MNGDTDQNRARSATVTVEFYDGTVRTIELRDDPEGIRLEGAIEINVEPREVDSEARWRTYEPGASTTSVRLSGLGAMRVEKPLPACLCPDVDVSTPEDPTATVKGWNPRCPVCGPAGPGRERFAVRSNREP